MRTVKGNAFIPPKPEPLPDAARLCWSVRLYTPNHEAEKFKTQNETWSNNKRKETAGTCPAEWVAAAAFAAT